MRTYVDNWRDCETFINYYIYDKYNIVIQYADGGTKIVLNNEENEKMILDQMEKQAHNALGRPLQKSQKYFIFSLVTAPIFLLYAIGYAIKLQIIFSYLCLFGGIAGCINVVEHYKRMKEIKKMQYFLKNKETFLKNQQEEIVPTNLSNHHNKSKIHSTQSLITINNVDNYSLIELKALKKQIEEYQRQQISNRLEDNVLDVNNKFVKKYIKQKR